MRPHSSDGDARRSSASSRMRASSRSPGSTVRWPSPTVRPRSRCVISSRDGWPESAVSSSTRISSVRRPRVSRKAERAASSRFGRCPTDISDESLLLVPLFRRGKREIVEHFDVIVVGAGPAGSAAALTLARKGFSTLLVERGRSPGAKGMFGGRIYAWPFAELIPEWAKDCPVERRVVRENLAFLTDDASLAISFDAPKMAQGRGASFTALRAKFDAWFAKKAQDAGAVLVTGIRVDDLWRGDGRGRGGFGAPGGPVGADPRGGPGGATPALGRKGGPKPGPEHPAASVVGRETGARRS